MMTQLFSEMTATVLPDLNQILYYMRRLPAQKFFFKKSRHYQLLRDFGEVSFISLFIFNHLELNTYMI